MADGPTAPVEVRHAPPPRAEAPRPSIDTDKVHGEGARMDEHADALRGSPALSVELQSELDADKTPHEVIQNLGEGNDSAEPDSTTDAKNAKIDTVDASTPPWQRAQPQTENASNEGSSLEDTKARVDAMNSKSSDELVDLAADGNILARRALANRNRDAAQATDGTTTTADVQSERSTDRNDPTPVDTNNTDHDGRPAYTAPDGSTQYDAPGRQRRPGGYYRDADASAQFYSDRDAARESANGAVNTTPETTTPAPPTPEQTKSDTETPTETTGAEQPQMTDAELSADVARRRYKQIHGEPMPDAKEPTATKRPDGAEPVVETDSAKSSETDTGPKAPEDNAETDAETELSPEAAERKRSMEMGAELAKMGIDASSKEGQKIFNLLAENPANMEVVQATAAFFKVGGPEAASAAASAAAETIDQQISAAQESGDEDEAKRLGLVKTLLLALGRALLAAGAVMVGAATKGAVSGGVEAAKAVAQNAKG